MKRNETRPGPPWKRVQGMDVGKAMLGGCVGLPWRTETLTVPPGTQRKGCLHRDSPELIGQEVTFQTEGVNMAKGGRCENPHPV